MGATHLCNCELPRSKTVVARKGSEKAVQSLCQEVVDFSRREMADRTNGIIEFGCSHDIEDANVFHFFERYTTNGKLGEHNVKEPVKKFMEKVGPYLLRPPSYRNACDGAWHSSLGRIPVHALQLLLQRGGRSLAGAS